LASQDLFAQPLALPDGEVRILNGQLRQGRRQAGAKSLVEDGHLPVEGVDGNPVGDDVVKDRGTDIILIAEFD
jgi:hypothetical protein